MDLLKADITGWPALVIVVVVLAALVGFRFLMMGKDGSDPIIGRKGRRNR